jgi:hypothetical protein
MPIIPTSHTTRRIILLNYREDGVTPYFTFWKYGMKEEKC